MKHGLSSKTVEKINAVLSRYPQVEQAILYGSRAKGNYKNGSDIDLTLCGGEVLTQQVLYRIMDELDDLLLPYTMDVSIFEELEDQALIGHIRRVGVRFYQRDEAWVKELTPHPLPTA
jgi:predicted nucleotidyltransferase